MRLAATLALPALRDPASCYGRMPPHGFSLLVVRRAPLRLSRCVCGERAQGTGHEEPEKKIPSCVPSELLAEAARNEARSLHMRTRKPIRVEKKKYRV